MYQIFDQVLVLVNVEANQGKAEKKWNLICNQVLATLPEYTQIKTFRPGFDLATFLSQWLARESKSLIISAGGDGTANHLINYLIRNEKENLDRITLGFIGLGSSNDILKPFQEFINDVPVALRLDKIISVDVGTVMFQNISGKTIKKYFLANASLGVIAEGNHLFNHPDSILKFVQKNLPRVAIPYASIMAILKTKNQTLDLEFNNSRLQYLIGFISVLKIPHISGNLKIDQEIKRDDGLLGLNYCQKMNKVDLLRLLIDLSWGKFQNRSNRYSYFIDYLKVFSEKHIPLEMDGEVTMAKDIGFGVLPKVLRLLT